MPESKIFYQIEYRQSGEQMLGSEDTTDEYEAWEIFNNAEFKGDCDAIELWEYEEDSPTFEGELLDSKELEN